MAGSLSRFDPFAEFSSIQRQLFSDGVLGGGRRLLPMTDIYTEDDSKLTVEAQLPGFRDEDIAIDIDRGALVIRAERKESKEEKGKTYLIRESSSSYYRRILLPEQADEDHVAANFKDGVLKVTVPYKAVESPRRVPIETGGKKDAS